MAEDGERENEDQEFSELDHEAESLLALFSSYKDDDDDPDTEAEGNLYASQIKIPLWKCAKAAGLSLKNQFECINAMNSNCTPTVLSSFLGMNLIQRASFLKAFVTAFSEGNDGTGVIATMKPSALDYSLYKDGVTNQALTPPTKDTCGSLTKVGPPRAKRKLVYENKDDHTSEWEGHELPDTRCQRLFLIYLQERPPDWVAQPKSIRRIFKKTVSPGIVCKVPEEDLLHEHAPGWHFCPEYLNTVKAATKEDEKDIKLLREVVTRMACRGMNWLALAASAGMDIVADELQGKNQLLESVISYKHKPFMTEALDVLYKAFRKPLAFDVILGARDKGGVYTELTMGSVGLILEQFKELGAMEPGMLGQEFGSGLGTFACHAAMVHGVYMIGVEIERQRLLYGLGSLELAEKLWDDEKMMTRLAKTHYQPSNIVGEEEADRSLARQIREAKEAVQGIRSKVRMVWDDALNAPTKKSAFIYNMDEAYNDPDVLKFLRMWFQSDVPYYGCYKPKKKYGMLHDFLREHPEVVVCRTVRGVRKISKGGSSTLVILGRLDLTSVEAKGLTFDFRKTGPSSKEEKETLKRCLVDISNLPKFSSMDPPGPSKSNADQVVRYYPTSKSGWTDPSWLGKYKECVSKHDDDATVLIDTELEKVGKGQMKCRGKYYIRCPEPIFPCVCQSFCNVSPHQKQHLEVKRSRIDGMGLFINQYKTSAVLVIKGTIRTDYEVPHDPETLAKSYTIGSVCITPDASETLARINHSCEPNCDLKIIASADDPFKREVVLVVKEQYRRMQNLHSLIGSELTIDYGDYSPTMKPIRMGCKCGSPKCRYNGNIMVLCMNYLSQSLLRTVEGNTAQHVMEVTRKGELQPQDGRDQYRIERLKEIWKKDDIYACSVDTERKNTHQNHIDCDISQSKHFISSMKKFQVCFERVENDYIWLPNEWCESHIKLSFFKATLPSLAAEGILSDGGVVILPFNPSIFKNLLVAEEAGNRESREGAISYWYQGDLLLESALAEDGVHYLWKATQPESPEEEEEFAKVFEKRISDSVKHYITWELAAFQKLLPDRFASKAEAYAKALGKARFNQIRFIRLTKKKGVKHLFNQQKLTS